MKTMKTMTMNGEQRAKVMAALAEVKYEAGRFEVEVIVDGWTLNAEGWVELDGYREDGYEDGTGAWVETHRSAGVTLTAYDEEGDEADVDCESCGMMADFLNAA